MQSHEFAVLLKTPPGYEFAQMAVEALGAAQCTDALIGMGTPGVLYLSFSREASSFIEALQSAFSDISKAFPGIALENCQLRTPLAGKN